MEAATIETVYVLDDYFGMTDAIVRFDGVAHLIEAVDWERRTTHPRVFRAGVLGEEVVQDFLRDVRRDYCDLTRKATQVAALGEQALWDDELIMLDVRANQWCGRFTPPTPVHLRPRDQFDGALVTYAQMNGCARTNEY